MPPRPPATKWGLALTALAVAALGGSERARAEEPHPAPSEPQYTLDGQWLHIDQAGSKSMLDLGCAGRQVLRQRDKLFVACGSAGVLQLDVSDPLAPKREGAMPVDGEANALFVRDGRIWVEIARIEARPLRIGRDVPVARDVPGTRSIPVATGATPPPAESTPDVSWSPPPPPPAAPEPPPVEPVEEPSITGPPRRGGLWDVWFSSSAFLAFGGLGAGTLGSASVAYRFEAPVTVRAELVPFGIAAPSTTTTSSSSGSEQTSSGGAVSAFGAHMVLGLDTQFIELGVGVGGVTINKNSATGSQPTSGSLSILESARFGARDGLAFTMESSAVGINGKFDLGFFLSTLQIPLTRTVMLVGRGGGGNVGFGYGDLGVRVVIHGDGGKGTLALTGFAGGALISLDLCSQNGDSPFTRTCNSANLAGPSLGGAIEWKR